MKRTLFLTAVFLPLLAVMPVRAQTPPSVELFADINPGPGFSMRIQRFVTFGGALYFEADDGTHGYELWKTDGTEAGTVMVKDIRPGPDGSTPFRFVVFDGALYFEADDGTHGSELWKTDGTEAGTVLVKDLRPGMDSGGPDGFTIFDGVLYFEAFNDTYGSELWKTDGTEGGTEVVDIQPGTESTAPYGITVFGDALYFGASSSGAGFELWRSDGTATGSAMVKDIRPGLDASFPRSLTVLDGALYFEADDGTHGYEMWTTDGTEAGTMLVTDLFPGPDPGVFDTACRNDRVVFDGALYYTGRDSPTTTGLWKTDGTAAGTTLVFEGALACAFTVIGDAFYFNSGGHGAVRSDGTPAGTETLASLTYVNGFEPFDGLVYFKGGDPDHGEELWVTDGTVAGTMLAMDINPGPATSMSNGGFAYLEYDLAPFNGALYFPADDGTHGFELWRVATKTTAVEPGGDTQALSLAAAPNPAHGAMQVRLSKPEAGRVTVAVYDALGRHMATLQDGPLGAGDHTLRFDAQDLPSGVYLVRAVSPSGVVARRVTLLR